MDMMTLDSGGELPSPSPNHNAVSTEGSNEDVRDNIHSSNEQEIKDNKTINHQFQAVADVAASKASDSDGNELLFEMKFHKNEVFDEIGSVIIGAIKTALKQQDNDLIDIICKRSESSTCLEVFRPLISTSHGLEPSNIEPKITEEVSPPDITQEQQKERSPDLAGLSELFTIDTEPAEKLETIKVPSYKRSIKDVLNEDSIQKSKKNLEDECKPIRNARSCFNCGSTNHSIRTCRKPRNLKRISQAKKAYSSKTDRYHIDEQQRFGDIRPGVISQNLRTALNLKLGELPFFFYRMRILGYPPGWLEEAKVTESGITLFNSEGDPVLKSDEDEGEIDVWNHKYDISKIVRFPGFNVDPGNNFFDDYKHHGVPPMNPSDFIEDFIKTLGDNILKSYKRKKLIDIPSRQPNEVVDMEIEDSEPQVEIEFNKPPLPSDEEATQDDISALQLDQTSLTVNSEDRSQSPTLEDLEARHLELLRELELHALNSPKPMEESVNGETRGSETTQESIAESSNHVETKTEVLCTTTKERDLISISLDKNDIKESHMGTPVLKFSPYERLPNGDKFKEGVSDVIFFENLPDSTGKYEHMKEVIQKIRKVVTKLNNEDN